MIAPHDSLFAALCSINTAGGTVFPRWSPATDSAIAYVVNDRELDVRDLDALVDRDLLRRIYVDRVSRCPGCRSHHLNVREICTACHSSHIASVELLHHFRCGYVAPSYEFAPEPGGRRCPKCHGVLRHRGTDHDVPGPHFVCKACSIGFQVPEIGLLCLACGTQTSGNDLEKILYQDVYGFAITSLGLQTLAHGTMLDGARDGEHPEDNSPVLRRSEFVSLLNDERKRREHFHTSFSLLSLSFNPLVDELKSGEQAFVAAIQAEISEVDKIGRFGDGHFMVLMPCTNDRHAQLLARKLNSSPSPTLREWKLHAEAVPSRDSERWADVSVIRGSVTVQVDA